MKAKPMPIRQPSFYLAFSLTLALAMILCDLMLSDSVVPIFKEGHSIEVMSVLLLCGAAILWFWLGVHRLNRRDWHIPVILLLMGLREMDFDKRFTSEGLLQLRLYSGAAPLWEKALGVAVIGLILWCGLRLAWINLPRWLRGIGRLQPVSWLVGCAALLLVVAKSLDGIDRKLAPFGIDIPRDVVMFSGRIEEVMEMVMALLLMQAVAVFAYRHDQNSASNGASDGTNRGSGIRSGRSSPVRGARSHQPARS